jgi:signal transduction histidine kinase
VIRLWTQERLTGMGSAVLEDMIRFNEAVDQAVAESTARYAAELDLSRDTFMAILAHDLRSPLSAIRILSHLLEDSSTTEAAKLQARQIERSAREMGTMIRDLLEYTRANLGKGIPVVPTECNIDRLCQEAVDEVRAGQPEREFVIDAPEDLAGRVDAARLRQALSNLLNNAVQHGQADSPVTLSAWATGSHVSIAVKNIGEPIPSESLQAIFDPLVQVSRHSDDPADKLSANLGLGLFIAREVALGHGGTIDVVSNHEDGTVFTMRLPMRAPA